MKKLLLILTLFAFACEKEIDDERPCGTYDGNTPLYKDKDGYCFYKIPSNGLRVYVEDWRCNCP